MSSQTGKWREDQVLIVCPGSQTTLAQLGCSELTPPAHRYPTRMFKDEEDNSWRPYHTFKRKKAAQNAPLAVEGPTTTDEDDDCEWVEDTDSDEGAVYPMQGGRIVNMEAFLAFLDHVHSMLTSTYHNTPIMLMASPQWTRPDTETIARYIFEKTRTPALCLLHSGIATQYGLRWPNMTVVDIGFEKVDVTCIFDSRVVSHRELGFPGPDRRISGGEVFTRKLLALLNKKDKPNSGGDDESKSFTYEMAEQLKRSHICEVLPYVPDHAQFMELPTASTAGAPASAPAGGEAPNGSGEQQSTKPAHTATAPVGEALNGDAEEEGQQQGEEGVLDVASIVTSGQTREYLAKKEKEKAKPGRKGKAQETEPPKPVRLPNSKRTHNVFHFEEVVQEEVQPPPVSVPAAVPAAAAAPAPAAINGNGAQDLNGSTGATKDDVEGDKVGEAKQPEDKVAPDPQKQQIDESKDDGENKDVEMADGAAPGPAETALSDPPAAVSEEKKPTDAADTTSAPAPAPAPAPASEANSAEVKPESATPAPAPESAAPSVSESTAPESAPASAPEPKPEASTEVAPAAASIPQEPRIENKIHRRDIEVGLERFTFADRGEIDRMAGAIYAAIQSIDDMYMRPPCWDHLVFVGNGARLRGLKDNIMQTLTARYLISPSTATMFTSELPSNIATPTGTGSQTPTSSYAGAPHQFPSGAAGGVPSASSGVNPLLQAATTASAAGAAPSTPGAPGDPVAVGGLPQAQQGQQQQQGQHSSHFHSQTPTSIKQAALPTYLSEWNKHGFEEAMFLGAQVAARLAFCVHNLDMAGLDAQRLMSLSRVDYNELGPKGIRTHSMLD